MSLTSRLVVAASFAAVTATAGATSAADDRASTLVHPTNNSVSTSANAGGPGGHSNNSININVRAPEPKPIKITQDLGSCDGDAFQAMFAKATYGRTEVTTVSIAGFDFLKNTKHVPEETLTDLKENSITFLINGGNTLNDVNRAYIAEKITGLKKPDPAEPKTETPASERSSASVSNNEQGAMVSGSVSVSAITTAASMAYRVRPATYMTFTCTPAN